MLSYQLILFGTDANGSLVATVDQHGDARGQGAVRVRDGTLSTTLIAEGTTAATCADTDGDGTAGLARLSIGLRDMGTTRQLTAEITPLSGDIDKEGRVKVKFPDLGADGDPLVVVAWLIVHGTGEEPGRLEEMRSFATIR